MGFTVFRGCKMLNSTIPGDSSRSTCADWLGAKLQEEGHAATIASL